MPIIKNNLYYELTTETQTKPVSAVKIQMDVLDGCEHNCSGCFVNRRNNAPSDDNLEDFSRFVKEITDAGLLVDEILIGPTDALSSSNTFDVLSNKHLLKTINDNSPILAFVTTLMGDPKEFCEFIVKNINLDTEIEIGIATQPDLLMDLNYAEEVKAKLRVLDGLPHDLTYTFILNIDEYDVDYEKLHKHVVKQFDTTFDLIPSIARSKNKEKILFKINQLNKHFNNLPSGNAANNIMVDHSHSGINFKVLNFKRGGWWLSPFLYENMAIYDDLFKVNTIDDLHNKVVSQYSYNTVCSSCEFLNSCSARSIPRLMKFLDTDECVCPKDVMIRHMHEFNKPASIMYDWVDYSVEDDKKGYRKKFLIHDEESEELSILEGIYNDRSR
ncbi:MAG: hypothetical protein NZ811_02750 [Gammaproteobacteria bacterium]|nr:hypothetical protein [Gammaproteobacteria bacterium]